MNNLPLVSILVPVYNVEKYIERCARSLFEQTYEYLEYIFVDDGITDKSKAVLERIISEYPHRESHVRVFSFPKNKGLATARNFLVDHCQTEWLMHVDADDWVEKDLVEHLVKKQLETGADFVVSGHLIHGNKNVESFSFNEFDNKADYLKLVLSDMRAHHIWGKLIRRSLYVKHSIRVDTDCVIAEDFRAFVRLAYYANRITSLRECGYHYDIQRVDRITIKNKDNLRIKSLGILDTLMNVRSFVSEKIPYYYDLFEISISYYCYMAYIYLSCTYGDREVHQMMCQKLNDLIIQHPTICSCFRDKLKFHLMNNYYCFSLNLRMKRLLHFQHY